LIKELTLSDAQRTKLYFKSKQLHIATITKQLSVQS